MALPATDEEMASVAGIVDCVRAELEVQVEHLVAGRHVDLLAQGALRELVCLLDALGLQESALLSQQQLRVGGLVGSLLEVLLATLDAALELLILDFLFCMCRSIAEVLKSQIQVCMSVGLLVGC